MERQQFKEPVRIWHRNNIIEITTVRQALAFLNSWPASRRGPVFQCAVNGCNAAVAGHLTADEARLALVSFARITGILADQHVRLAG